MRIFLELVREIERMQPGQQIEISLRDREFMVYPLKYHSLIEAVFNSIIGSAYSMSCIEAIGGGLVFYRLKREEEDKIFSSGLRTYVEQDRMDLFRRRPDGMYERRGQ